MDLRKYLRKLEQRSELLAVPEPIDSDFGIAAALHLVDGGPALRFDDVAGMRVIGNLLSTRARIAMALGCDTESLGGRLLAAIQHPEPVEIVGDGPLLEHEEEFSWTRLPVPRFFAGETAPYVTGGVTCARSPKSGRMNLSFARVKVLDGARGLICISPNHHLSRMVEEAAAVGEALPVQIAFGVAPAVEIAACLYLGYGESEEGAAGALLGAPLRVAQLGPARTNVPVDTEYAIEGEIDGRERVVEGPVSEFHGMYEDYGSGYVIHFSRIRHRTAPMFRVVMPGLHQEHLLLGAVPIAAGLMGGLRRLGMPVADVAVPAWASGRCAAIVSVCAPRPGDARRIMLACMSQVSLIKEVIVVDDDIDPWDTEAVEWARTTRCRNDEDLLVVPQARSDRSDPLAADSVVAKIGYDATRAGKQRRMGWQLATLPPDSAVGLPQPIRDRIRQAMMFTSPGIGLRVPRPVAPPASEPMSPPAQGAPR